MSIDKVELLRADGLLPHIISSSVPSEQSGDSLPSQLFANHAVIFQAGDAAGRLFMVANGAVRLYRAERGAARNLVSILSRGEVFGDLSDGEDAAMLETAVASGETRVRQIDGSQLEALASRQPRLAVELVQSISDRNRWLRQRIQWFAKLEVHARLAQTLLMLAHKLADPCEHGGEFDLRDISQQDLGDLVGASRSFVSTVINEMKGSGALSSVGRTLCIRDSGALRRIGAS